MASYQGLKINETTPGRAAGLIAQASPNGLPTIAARQVGAKAYCLVQRPRQERVSQVLAMQGR